MFSFLSHCLSLSWLIITPSVCCWRRQWQPTPVFLSGESHGQQSLASYSPWGHKESDATEWWTHTHTHTHTHTWDVLNLLFNFSKFNSFLWWRQCLLKLKKWKSTQWKVNLFSDLTPREPLFQVWLGCGIWHLAALPWLPSIWVHVPTLPLPTCVTLSKWFNFSGSSFLQVKNWDSVYYLSLWIAYKDWVRWYTLAQCPTQKDNPSMSAILVEPSRNTNAYEQLVNSMYCICRILYSP